MVAELRTEDAEKILKGISIPPRPTVLAKFMQESSKPDPDFARIGSLISSDVSLSAAMLKTVNSPYFGLRQKITSVSQAVIMMGLKNVVNIVSGLVLRKAIGGKGISLERFWDSSERVANFSAYLAKKLPGTIRDEAYTFGLFHNCGIPLLMQRFPDYMETLKIANTTRDKSFLEVEDERHSTNHAVVGHLMAKNWLLPDTISEAILHHHNFSILAEEGSVSGKVQTLVAVTCLAEHLNNTLERLRDDPEWERVGQLVLDYLGFSNDELEDIKEDIYRFQ